jgi:hypothetical protein
MDILTKVSLARVKVDKRKQFSIGRYISSKRITFLLVISMKPSLYLKFMGKWINRRGSWSL